MGTRTRERERERERERARRARSKVYYYRRYLSKKTLGPTSPLALCSTILVASPINAEAHLAGLSVHLPVHARAFIRKKDRKRRKRKREVEREGKKRNRRPNESEEVKEERWLRGTGREEREYPWWLGCRVGGGTEAKEKKRIPPLVPPGVLSKSRDKENAREGWLDSRTKRKERTGPSSTLFETVRRDERRRRSPLKAR